MSSAVTVAVGVIVDRQRVLIARRADNSHQGGKWEFPGGKVESGELVAEALRRELREELAIDVTASSPLLVLHHDYGDKQVVLDVWWVNAFDGEPTGCEGQPLQWVTVDALSDYEFPAANAAIVSVVQSVLRTNK